MRRIIRKTDVVLSYLVARARAPRMLAASDGASRTVLTALVRTLRFELTPEERAWTTRLEVLRRELLQSRDPIERILYGWKAGMARPRGEPTASGRRIVHATVGDECRCSSRQRFWCVLLFRLVRELRPERCLEFGTAFGMSAAYQAAALALNGTGRLVTLEGDAGVAEIARTNLGALGLANVTVVQGEIRDTQGTVIACHAPVDMVFFDAGKTRVDVLGHLAAVAPSLAPRAVLVFDDIGWSAEMKTVWDTLCEDRRFTTTLDLGEMGICCLGPETEPRRTLQLRMA